jgi:O-antigen ligase
MLILLIIIISLIINIDSIVSNEILSRFNIDRIISSGGSGRIDIWEFYINKIKEQNLQEFLFGYGFGSSFYNPFVPHNQLITLQYENGIFGVFLFVLLWCSYLLKKPTHNNYLLFYNIGIFITTLFLTVTIDKYFWINFLLANSLYNNPKIPRGQKNEDMHN